MTRRISRDEYGLKLAEAAALRADCTRRQVGAVIVAEDGSIVATGYNGRASGLPGCLTDGACPRGQMAYPAEPPVRVGEWVDLDGVEDSFCDERSGTERDFMCVFHRDGWHVATGSGQVLEAWPIANAQPPGVGYAETGCDAAHAEANAIIRAGRDKCLGATIYVTDEPCHGCAVLIAAAGLQFVVTPARESREEGDEEWQAAELREGVRKCRVMTEKPTTLWKD